MKTDRKVFSQSVPNCIYLLSIYFRLEWTYENEVDKWCLLGEKLVNQNKQVSENELWRITQEGTKNL